jgi:hypothetical protein
MPHPTPDDLEKMIHQTLRVLPPRRAPRSLEDRVLAAIEARQSLPWWKQSFAHWPMAARVAFLLLTSVLAAALISLFFHADATAGASSLFSGPLMLLAHVKAAAVGTGNIGALVVGSIPSYWIYGVLGFVAVMYAALAGLGATAYRLFFNPR